MTSEQVFERNGKKFFRVFEAVKQLHEKEVSPGHGIDHDLMVAQYAAIISGDERVGEMLWVAGLLHSLDRFQCNLEEELGSLLGLLPEGEFSYDEIGQIRVAVLEHGKKNSDDDGPVAVALKDADRLANLGAITLIRSGQFFHNKPACKMDSLHGPHPGGNYKNPTCSLDDVYYMMEWESKEGVCLRLPRAKEMARRRCDFMRVFLAFVQSEFEEAGLAGIKV